MPTWALECWQTLLTWATGLWDFLDSPEIGWHLILLVLLWLVGRVLVRNHPRAKQWGQGFAVVTLFACLLLRWAQADSRSAETIAGALGRSLLAAGLALGFGWTVFPALAMAYSVSLGPVIRMLRRSAENRRAWRARLEERRREEQERRAALREWEAGASERARLEREAARREQAAAAAERHRQDACARAEAFYLRHAPELGERFSRQEFDDYLQRYLAAGVGPAEADQRVQKLESLITHHLGFADRAAQRNSLAGLIRWSNEEKRKIEDLELAPDEEEEIVGNIEAQFARLQARFIRNMKP